MNWFKSKRASYSELRNAGARMRNKWRYIFPNGSAPSLCGGALESERLYFQYLSAPTTKESSQWIT